MKALIASRRAATKVKKTGRQAESFCSDPTSGVFAALVFGKTGAPVSELSEDLAKQWIKRTQPALDRRRMSPEEAKQDPGGILDALCSESLFGGASLLQVSIARETEARPFLDALTEIENMSEPPNGKLLIVAGDLTPRSKLRKTFEDHKSAIALQIFERSERDFENWVRDQLSANGLRLEPDAEILLLRTLLEDQSLAPGEIEKLALYAVDLDRPLTEQDIRDLIILEDQSTGFDLVDLALDGKLNDLAGLMGDQLKEGSGAIPVLIGLMNQLKRLNRAHEVSGEGIHGPKIGERLSPRVFDRQWPAFERRMQKWPPDRILTLMTLVAQADAQCRTAGSPQEALVGKLLLDVAQVASHAGRRRA